MWRRKKADGDFDPTVEPAPPSEPAATAYPPPTKDVIDAVAEPRGRMARLRSRLGGGWGSAVLSVLRRSSLTDADWEELEEILLGADVGTAATDDLLVTLKQAMKNPGDKSAEDVLRGLLIDLVNPTMNRALALPAPGSGGPTTMLVVGVNGVGKTTSVGKIARMLIQQGYSVVLGAADTFRAAAADQLATWGAAVGATVVRADKDGADPASVAFMAADAAVQAGADVLLIDTAGRLHNKRDLMDELGKVVRVVTKTSAPAETLLVLDATTGQNGLTQAKVFAEVVGLTGIVLTKLDGSARGGIVISVQRELGIPVKFVGLGEGRDDLAPFDPEAFVDGVLGR